jgi:hypothetical protein
VVATAIPAARVTQTVTASTGRRLRYFTAARISENMTNAWTRIIRLKLALTWGAATNQFSSHGV